MDTAPAARLTTSDTLRSCGDRNIRQPTATSAAVKAATGVATASTVAARVFQRATVRKSEKPMTPTSPAAMADSRTICQRSLTRRPPPSGSRLPTPSTGVAGWVGVDLDLLSQPAHVHGDRRLVAERPAPHLAHQVLAARTHARVPDEEDAAGRTRAPVSGDQPCPRGDACAAAVDHESPSTMHRGRVRLDAPVGRRSTDSTRSTSSRGLNGLVT